MSKSDGLRALVSPPVENTGESGPSLSRITKDQNEELEGRDLGAGEGLGAWEHPLL